MNDHLQLLKIEILANGIGLTSQARRRLTDENAEPLSLADYATTSGVTLRLPADIWVNAPVHDFNPNFVNAPKLRLDLVGDDFFINTPEQRVPVYPVPLPRYTGTLNDSEEPHIAYGITHSDRVRISPIQGCSMVCTFCDLPYEHRYRRKRIDGLIGAVSAALDDERLPAHHILISGGTPKPDDYDFLRTVYRTIPETFPGVAVDVMMVPAEGLLQADELYRFGINELSINLEVFGSEALRKFAPLKARLGTEYYLEFIEDAVEVFGRGRVRSIIIVGLEPVEDTLKGIEALSRRGCFPVLSPFRPDPSTPLRNHPAPTADFLFRLWDDAREIAERFGVKLGPACIPCQHNTLSFPDGSDYYHYTESPTRIRR